MHHKLIKTFLCILYKGWVLEPFKILIIPIHKNVRLFRQYLKIGIIEGVFFEGHLVEEKGIENIIFTK